MLAWGLLLAPFFTPSLLVSYAFSKFALALVVSSWSHEALYLGVLTLKLIPAAVVVRVLVPSPLSGEARHIHRSLATGSWRQRARFAARGAGVGPWIAGGLVFLLAFSEFELASLWTIHTWTVALFDAQTGGLALLETLRLAAAPLAVELVLLAFIFRCISRIPHIGQRPEVAPRCDRVRATLLGWLYLALAAAIVCFLPLAIILRQAVAGLSVWTEHFLPARELGASFLFALAAAILADALSPLGRRRSISALVLAAPGLLGGLALSVLIRALFQAPPLRPAYDTPLPLLFALTTLLLPLALLLGASRSAPTPGLHLARQFGSRRLVWEMETRPHAVALGLLFFGAWFDFTAASILAPVGLTPVFVRLHNLAHYGQTAALSTMMLVAFATPMFALLLTGAALRLLAGRK
jgi:hypothetical protein